jgi:hypothetical protein
MRFFFHALLLVLPTAPCALAQSYCTGQLPIPGGFLSGTCNGGNCSAYLSSQLLSGAASCTEGISARIRGNRNAGFANARCNGNSLSFYFPSDNVSLQGECSDGTRFYGSAQVPGGFVNGNCTQNGGFNAYLSGTRAQVSGYCR